MGSVSNNILEGVRVVAFTNGYAGPYAGRLLAQFGADVIKIESRSGGVDSFRQFGETDNLDAAPRFIECNLGVRSFAANLKHPTGVRLIKELVAHSDAVLVNFRPGVLQRLGLGDEELRQANPGIVILKLPGLGESGPKGWYGSWGFNLTAFTGMTHLWNHPEQGRPVGSQGVYPDHVTFVLAPTLLIAALLRRRSTGQGALIDLAQAEATAYMLGVSLLETTVNHRDPEARGNRDPAAAPSGCYSCKGDDRWCVISVRTDEQWHSLCRVMGRRELIVDVRFSNRRARCRHRVALDQLVEEWTSLHSAEEITTRLQADGVAAGLVENAADLMGDPQLRHRNYFEHFPSSPIGPIEVPRSAFQFRDQADEPLSPAPDLGEHTDEIMRDLLGYDDGNIDQWKAEGILV